MSDEDILEGIEIRTVAAPVLSVLSTALVDSSGKYSPYLEISWDGNFFVFYRNLWVRKVFWS